MNKYIIISSKEKNATHKNLNNEFFKVIDVTNKVVEGENVIFYDSLDNLILLNNESSTPIVKELSKLFIRRKLREFGKEDQFDALLDSIPQARKDWDDAISIKTDDPLFSSQSFAFKDYLNLTDEQFSLLLEQYRN
jgi:hypothetical protein